MRTILISLSESRALRGLAEKSSLGQQVSGRFVAGTQLQDALRVTESLNASGLAVSVDNLGENVANAAEARQSAALYEQLLKEMSARGLDANVSLKLTHMGLDVDHGLAYELARGLVMQAASVQPKNFVRIDMEGSDYTQRTLDLVRKLHRELNNCGCVGAVIQSYMRRSEADVGDLLKEGIRIRLCKGAYKEPPDIAYQSKAEVDASYIRLMKALLRSGVYHGLATHDQDIIREAQSFVIGEKIPRDAFEFQMLYGIRRDLQQALVREGWRVRVYVPFGSEWYPYLMRRLAERPANLGFVIKNMFRG